MGSQVHQGKQHKAPSKPNHREVTGQQSILHRGHTQSTSHSTQWIPYQCFSNIMHWRWGSGRTCTPPTGGSPLRQYPGHRVYSSGAGFHLEPRPGSTGGVRGAGASTYQDKKTNFEGSLLGYQIRGVILVHNSCVQERNGLVLCMYPSEGGGATADSTGAYHYGLTRSILAHRGNATTATICKTELERSVNKKKM